MAKRNHFNKIEMALIKTFIYEIDPCIEVFRGRRYEVDIDEEKVFLGNKRFDRISKIFVEHWQPFFQNININWCVLSILHEVGHIMTATDEIRDNRFLLDNIYSFLYSENAINELEYFNSYFDIPAEYDATLWGINYYIQNKEKCDKLAKQLGVF